MTPFFSVCNSERYKTETYYFKGSWPWMAALRYRNKSNPNNGWLCVGSLITTRHVLTAAHCVKPDLYMARLGEHDFDQDLPGEQETDVLIESATVHPNYSKDNLINDIAILKLRDSVRFTSRFISKNWNKNISDILRNQNFFSSLVSVHPICLPLPDKVRYQNFDNFKPFLAGWGSVLYRK